MNSQNLEQILAEKGITRKHCHLLRSAYILENQHNKFLLTFTNKATYPHIPFGKKWQFLNDTHWGCDLFDTEEDEIETICECVHQYTNIRMFPEQITLLHFETGNTFKADPTLFLAFHIKLESRNQVENFKFWGEYCYDKMWVAKSEILDKLEVAIDKKIFEILVGCVS
jgi:hypothetical protein